ncbi:MAG TPA: CBS domain-containing protein [Bradyrhizobium sp.]|uniref:CBS domain-containing protein n=1 Tax=Bradyrhizobium sp. TaxID=376 RepID=UPI002D7E83D7|nr:CBS domain-containing protein [Bradyrhizobium sp.]HET7885772.1 CBS domain-containing protein [Bradyrhizobium sp.]
MRAHQIMSRNVITIDSDASLQEAIESMLTHHISGLPVVDAAGKLVGIVSEGDFVRRTELGTDKRRSRWLSLLAGPDQVAVDFTRQHGRKVSQIMSPSPITVGEETALEQIVRLMESRNVHRFPVMRGEEIVGMITRSDFLTAIAHLPPGAAGYSDSDDQIRSSAIAALSHASWRPCALNVTVRDGVATVRGTVKSDNARSAALVAVENIRGVKRVEDQLSKISYPPPEEDYGGGDFVSLQSEPSTADDEPL